MATADFVASAETLVRICKRLTYHYIDCPASRPSIAEEDYDSSERYWDDHLQEKLAQLLLYIQERPVVANRNILVFCDSIYGAEKLAKLLSASLNSDDWKVSRSGDSEAKMDDKVTKENLSATVYIVADTEVSQLVSVAAEEIVHLSLPFLDSPNHLFSFHLRRADDLQVDFRRYLKRFELVNCCPLEAEDGERAGRKIQLIHLIPEETRKPFADLIWLLERLFVFGRLSPRDYIDCSVEECIDGVMQEFDNTAKEDSRRRAPGFALARIGLAQDKRDLEIMKKFKSLLRSSLTNGAIECNGKLGDGDDDTGNNPFL